MLRSIFKSATFLALAAAAAIGISGGPASAANEASYAAGQDHEIESSLSFLVTAEWLKANLDKVMVIDARDQALYKGQQGHIPGAVNAPWTYFARASKPGDPNSYTVLGPAELAKALGNLGIDGKKEVIVYGDGGDWGNAAWVVWILRMKGDTKAKMLDGGWTAWRAAGGKTSSTTHTNKAVAHPAIKFAEGYFVTTDWLKEHINDPAVKIVDVRTPQEYEGKIRPFGEKRPGHIPGAICFSWGEVMTDDFKIIDEDSLIVKLASFFPNKDQEIIFYDTNGVRSAFMTMVFRLADYRNARNYDASFKVWCEDESTEVRQGPNP